MHKWYVGGDGYLDLYSVPRARDIARVSASKHARFSSTKHKSCSWGAMVHKHSSIVEAYNILGLEQVALLAQFVSFTTNMQINPPLVGLVS